MLRSMGHPGVEAAMLARYPAAERMTAGEGARKGQRAFAEKHSPQWRGR